MTATTRALFVHLLLTCISFSRKRLCQEGGKRPHEDARGEREKARSPGQRKRPEGRMGTLGVKSLFVIINSKLLVYTELATLTESPFLRF